MADSLYVPDPEAADTLLQPWDEAFRTQRDVGLLVPINYHTVPSVSLRAACFSTNQYEDVSFQKCFSNLLAVGLRRFEIDTYWDSLRGEWSLCPVEIPPSDSGGSSSSIPVPTVSLSDTVSSTSAGVVASVSSLGLKRQNGDSSSDQGAGPSTSASFSAPSAASSVEVTSSTSPSGTYTASSTSSSTASSPVALPDQDGGTLFILGDYNCTSTMTLNYLTGIFRDFLGATSTTTGASFTYLRLNIHAAASWKSPSGPAQRPADNLMPAAVGNLLGDLMKGNFSKELYTPSKLADQRAHVGSSWNSGADDSEARPGYYSVQDNGHGVVTTENGWPTEAYVQFRDFFRLIAIFGTIDPQMEAYNRSQDALTIFPADTIDVQSNITFAPNGTLNNGCLFDRSATGITAQTNSSFAFATVPSSADVDANPNLFEPIGVVSNLTACGISPVLNHTLANVTADMNPLPYAAFSHSYLWTWAPGEPLNATDPESSGATGNRCAAAYTGGAYPGRWHVVDCTTPLLVACQDPSSPYAWSLSSSPASYDFADDACENRVFSVPHTPLENTHLLSAARTARRPSNSKVNTSSILINLNSMDISDCWVAEVNGTCPYQPPSDENQTRIVVIPTVAAIIIFVVTALTFFVKCASNRREDKRGRRRRMLEGWEYEGVPS